MPLSGPNKELTFIFKDNFLTLTFPKRILTFVLKCRILYSKSEIFKHVCNKEPQAVAAAFCIAKKGPQAVIAVPCWSPHLSVQPLVYVVRNHTPSDRNQERNKYPVKHVCLLSVPSKKVDRKIIPYKTININVKRVSSSFF